MLLHYVNSIAPPGISELRAWAKGRGSAEIVGRVVREDGQAMANVDVSVTLQSQDLVGAEKLPPNTFQSIYLDADPRLRNIFAQSVVTDANGNFRISGLASAPYRIRARLDESAWRKDSASVPNYVALRSPYVVAREKSSTRSPDIALVRGGLINVQAVDDTTGKPLSKVSLFAQNPPRESALFWGNQTNEQGKMTFRVVTGQAFVVMSSRPRRGFKEGVVEANGRLYIPRPAKVLVDGQSARASSSGIAVNVEENKSVNVQVRYKPYVALKKISTSSTRSD